MATLASASSWHLAVVVSLCVKNIEKVRPCDLKSLLNLDVVVLTWFPRSSPQRSFHLTEEEYLLHLDDIANNLRCWGAVGLVRNSLEKTKERPRIGKAS